ncbi:hypothetical protein BH24ACT7_BH24ACT7_13830 [soil metagenome]
MPAPLLVIRSALTGEVAMRSWYGPIARRSLLCRQEPLKSPRSGVDDIDMSTTSKPRARPRPMTLAALALSLLVSTLVTTPAPATAAPGDVVVDGSGWGHGVGMSQYGAYGMAKEGYTHGEILAHYYQGSGLTKLGTEGLDLSPPIWVNLEMDFSSITLRVDAIVGDGKPVTVTRAGVQWTVPVGSTIQINGPSNCYLVIDPPGEDNTYETPKAGCAFTFKWYAWRTTAQPKTALAIVGCTLTDWNVSPTVARECKYARGSLVVRPGEGGLDLSAKMKLYDYVRGIAEMPYAWGSTGGMEALKVQAIAARSYARELMLQRGAPASNSCAAWCHVRDTTWDQRYVGWGHGQPNWETANATTAGWVVTHPDAPNQTIVRAYYSSSTGGATESIEEVWTGWDARAYYHSVDDHWAVDGTVTNPNAAWTVSIANADLASDVGLATITDAWVSVRNTSGSANTISFTDGTTTVTKTGSWLRTTYGLKSIYVDVSLEG